MKKTILILVLPFLSLFSFSQNQTEAEKLVDEGVAYQDKGDFDGAIARFDKALLLDKDNLKALAEKAYTLCDAQRYDEAVTVCKLAIEKHPGEKYLAVVYVTYGNSLDGLKKTDASIDIYNEGIKQFPDYYQLYFNKGITQSSVKKYDDAILSFQKAVAINPKHASSHNAMARLLEIKNKRIPAIMAYCRFLILEPQSKRAKDNLESLQRMMKGNVEKTGKKSITININPDMMGDTTADGKPKENNFGITDMILSMDAALDFDKKNAKKPEVEQFIRKFETVCSSLQESRKDNYGFFWDYYVPYFTEMKDNDLVEPFAYIAFATSDDPDVAKWLKKNQDSIDKFYTWSKNFNWKTD
jgi:Tfp pilus assembly protein PilF